MMATVPHVTSGLGLRKFQADGFLLTRVYMPVWYSRWLPGHHVGLRTYSALHKVIYVQSHIVAQATTYVVRHLMFIRLYPRSISANNNRKYV